MERSLARGALPPDRAWSRLDRAVARASVATGLAVVFVLLVTYAVSNPARRNTYEHFVWQASAWLEGEVGIRYPVTPADGLGISNQYYQDVLPIRGPDGTETGRALIPFPPLPAVVLLPFVALFGLATNESLIAVFLGAGVVGLGWWVIGRLPVRPTVRLATTIFFGLGTVFWFAAQLGSTWYLAHIVAVGLTFLAIAIALDGDPAAVAASADDDRAGPAVGLAPGPPATGRRLRLPGLDGRQVLAGVCLGLAACSRLTVVLGLPFLVLVGAGGTWQRRAASAALGAAIPVAALLLYDVATTGDLFHPGYEYLYQVEIGFYPILFPYLHYHADWALEDPRYIPQNLALMLFNPPEILPSCPDVNAVRSLFSASCPFIRPRGDGLSLLLVSPAWLLALPSLRAWGRSRLVTGAALAVLAIALGDLMHFSQGWVQFGYRFSNDFAPFLLLLVALGMERMGGVRPIAVVLIGWSIAVQLWGVVWDRILGW